MAKKTQCLLILLFLLTKSNVWAAQPESVGTLPASLFGYQEIQKNNLNLFPQWLSVLERHVLDMEKTGSCQSTRFNRCHLKQWQAFLQSIKNLPARQQIK